MQNNIIWVKRKFKFDLSPEMFPLVIERLRGTPARLEDKTASLSEDILKHKDGDAWSIQETVGHLGNVEVLWHGRIDDFHAGLEEFRPANITNTVTAKVNHNEAEVKSLLEKFRTEREILVTRFDEMTIEQVARSAYHRRLDIQMRLIDLAEFIAEHDDHHLSKITDMIQNLNK